MVAGTAPCTVYSDLEFSVSLPCEREHRKSNLDCRLQTRSTNANILARSMRCFTGTKIIERFVAFLEATATTFPDLQEVFNYCHNAMTDRSSATFDSVAPPESLRELISNMTENPSLNHTFTLLRGHDVLNKEFKPRSAEMHNGDDPGASDAANSLLDQFGETDDGSGELFEDKDDAATSEDERDGKSDSSEQRQMTGNYTNDDSDDDDDNIDDHDDEDEDSGLERPAKRQKIGSFPSHTRR